MLVAQVAGRAGAGEPNLVLFDVQGDQRQSIAELIKSQGISLHGEVPDRHHAIEFGEREESRRASRQSARQNSVLGAAPRISFDVPAPS